MISRRRPNPPQSQHIEFYRLCPQCRRRIKGAGPFAKHQLHCPGTAPSPLDRQAELQAIEAAIAGGKLTVADPTLTPDPQYCRRPGDFAGRKARAT